MQVQIPVLLELDLMLCSYFSSGRLSVCSPVCRKPQSECLPPCPISCCNEKFHINPVKRSDIGIIPISERSKVIRQSCSCLMECDGSASLEDSERCHEKCTCHQDKDASSLSELEKGSEHVHTKKGRKKFSRPHFGTKEMDKIKHLFTKWIKEYNGGGHETKANVKKMGKSKTLKDERVSFISTMLKNYQYFRQKEKTLRLLQQQQDELTNQQQHLENLLTKQEGVISKTGSVYDTVATLSPAKSGPHHSHADDINITITTTNTTQPPPTTKATNVSAVFLNQQTLNDIEGIKKQITDIRGQQDFLAKQQSQLAVQLAKEQALFEQARQLIALVVKQNQAAAAAAAATDNAASTSTSPQTQSDYEGELNPEEPPPKVEAVRDSGLLDKLQSLLSRLVFSEDDGQQMMFVPNNQEDQSNRIENGNSLYAKNADIDQVPGNMMYKVPVEIDRSDLNERNGIDNSESEDDNDNAFTMDRGDSDDDTGPNFVVEKKTLHPHDETTNPHKTSSKTKYRLSDQTNKTNNHGTHN